MSDWLDAEAHADRALEWFERGRWADAEAELRKAIALNPDQAEWHFNLALTLEAAGRDAEALASYEHAIGLLPEEVEPLVAAGVVCNRLGQHRRAIERLERALSLDRTLETPYPQLMEAHLRLGDHDEVEATFYLAQLELPEPSAACFAVMAESLIIRETWERAEWCLKRALQLDPSLPRLRARLGAIHAATGRPQRALQLYLRDLRDDPGSIETLMDYGELLLSLGRLPDAAEKFRRVLELEPANVDAHHRLGRIAVIARRWEQAYLEFELVMRLDATYPQIRLDVAESLLGRGKRGEARGALSEELEAQRAREEQREALPVGDFGEVQEVAYRRRLGELLLQAGRPRPAADQLHRASLIARDDVGLLRSLALACFLAGDRDGGTHASRRVLRLDPDCVRSLHNLALAAMQAGRLRIAAGWIARGMRADRNDIGIRRLRIRLWLAMASARLTRMFGDRA